MNPWVMLGALLAALALFGSGYKMGVRNADNACVTGQVKEVQAAQTAANTETDRRETIGAARETSREQIRIVYKTIKEQADDYVKKHPHPNPDGTTSHSTKHDKAVQVAGYLPPAGEGANEKGNLNYCGLDADGLRVWNAANSGVPAPLSSEPDRALPAATSGQVGQPGGFVEQSHRGDGAGSAVPRSAEQAGGVYYPPSPQPSPASGRGG